MIQRPHPLPLPIPGYDKYEVSDLGRVRRVFKDGKTTRLRRLVRNEHGYSTVSLHDGLRARRRLVHQLVLLAFAGPAPEGMEGCHNDGNPANDRLDNLRWDTHAANMSDKRRHGTQYQLNKTHCLRRHILAEPNLRQAQGVRRSCLACTRAGNQVRRAAQRGRVVDLQTAADAHYARIMGSADPAE